MRFIPFGLLSLKVLDRANKMPQVESARAMADISKGLFADVRALLGYKKPKVNSGLSPA